MAGLTSVVRHRWWAAPSAQLAALRGDGGDLAARLAGVHLRRGAGPDTEVHTDVVRLGLLFTKPKDKQTERWHT